MNQRFTRKDPTGKLQGSVYLLLLTLLLLPSLCFAQESRFALLVGNTTGWKGDPTLQYAINGDVQPLARTLRKLGFRVQTLLNKDAATLRQRLTQLRQSLQADTSIKTFVFYYSGHSDKKYLHLGRKGKNPFSYEEFSRWFRTLKVKRRIVIFDSCFSGELIRQFGSIKKYQYLLKHGRSKGVRRIRRINIKNLLMPNQGSEEGLRVISSSYYQAWELKHLKASVFTHFLLKGLKGKADLDQDGKISVDELFDYTSLRVQQKTGQKPQQLLLLKRSNPYAFAPSYQSRMLINSQIKGNLRIRVGNFIWSQQKQKTGPLRLAVVHGKADVYLQKKQRCFHQSLRIPKGREVTLGSDWTPVRCQRYDRRSKGSAVLRMPAQPWVATPSTYRSVFAVGGGFVQQGGDDLRGNNGLVQIGFRRGFWGLNLEIQSTQPDNKQFSLTRFQVQGELGWTFRLLPALGLFTGGYLGLGPVYAHSATRTGAPAFTWSTGAKVDLSWWFLPKWGLRLGGAVGLDSMQTVAETNGLSLAWSLRAAVLFQF